MPDHELMNDTTTTQREAPGTPYQAPPLVRPRDDRVIAGVASGLAARLGIGTGWVRAGFVIATLVGGSGLLLYIIGWLAIPEEGEKESIAASKVGDIEDSSRWVGIGLIVVGVLIVLSWTDVIHAELIWAGALILVGVLLYRGEFPAGKRRSSDSESSMLPAPPPPPPPAVAAEVAEGLENDEFVSEDRPIADAAPLPPAPLPPPDPPIPSVPKPRRARSMLGRFTLATMFIAVGALALLDNGGVIEPAARHYVGAVVGVVGLGLIVGAWVGRSRGLIALGILLLPVLLVASVVRVPFSNDFGEKIFRPTSAAVIQDEYRLGAGDLRLDLRRINVENGGLDLEASVGAGRLVLIVPRDVAVAIDSRVGFGELEVFGLVRNGIGREIHSPAPVGAIDVISIDLEVGFGQLQVIRASN